MSPRAPRDRKLARSIKNRVSENGLRGSDRVLYLNAEGEVLTSLTPSAGIGPVSSDQARTITDELLASGDLAAVVHLFAAYLGYIQFGVVEVYAGATSTVHGLVSGGTPQWVPLTDEISTKWNQTWNERR